MLLQHLQYLFPQPFLRSDILTDLEQRQGSRRGRGLEPGREEEEDLRYDLVHGQLHFGILQIYEQLKQIIPAEVVLLPVVDGVLDAVEEESRHVLLDVPHAHPLGQLRGIDGQEEVQPVHEAELAEEFTAHLAELRVGVFEAMAVDAEGAGACRIKENILCVYRSDYNILHVISRG